MIMLSNYYLQHKDHPEKFKCTTKQKIATLIVILGSNVYQARYKNLGCNYIFFTVNVSHFSVKKV